MKKEYIILILLIVLVGAYITFHDENADHYTLPQVDKIPAADIQQIDITSKDGDVSLVRKNDKWVMGKQEYPADPQSLKDITEALSTLKISALISQSKDVTRYDLDEKDRISVKVTRKDSKTFSFNIGKTAPTMNHTYVMLEGDTNVYQANSSFRTYFAENQQGLRDKSVMTFSSKDIKSVSIAVSEKTEQFTRMQKEEKDKPPVTVWTTSDGSSTDAKNIQDLLGELAGLECESFLADDAAAELSEQAPVYSVSLNDGGGMTLKLYKKEGKEAFSAISSMSQYAFTLNSYVGGQIEEHVQKLLGIETSTETKGADK